MYESEKKITAATRKHPHPPHGQVLGEDLYAYSTRLVVPWRTVTCARVARGFHVHSEPQRYLIQAQMPLGALLKRNSHTL